MNKLELFRNSFNNLIGNLIRSTLYKVELKYTGDILKYTGDIIGDNEYSILSIISIPVYKQRYIVSSKNGIDMKDIISILSEHDKWFENLEDAQAHADNLNKTLEQIENDTLKIEFEDFINETE